MRTTTGTYGNGGSYTLEYPEMMSFIYSPHVFVRMTLADADGNAVAGVRLQCVLTGGGGTNTNNFRYTDGNGSAVFDIARTLQVMIGNREEEMLQPYATHAWKQYMYAVDIYSGSSRIVRVYVETANGSDRITDNWLSGQRRLKCWANYPFTIDMSNSDGLIVDTGDGFARRYAVVMAESSLVTQMVRRPLSEFLRDVGRQSYRWVKITLPTDVAGVSFKDGVMMSSDNAVLVDIDRCQQDLDRRAYLRWMGRHGEIYYWLFFVNEKTYQTKTDVYRRPMTYDGYEGSDPLNRVLLNGEVRDSITEETISLYSELISAEHYAYARSVAFSPYVDMYLGDGKWQRVSVNDSTQSMEQGNEKAKRHRIALTIKTGEV